MLIFNILDLFHNFMAQRRYIHITKVTYERLAINRKHSV